MATLMAGDGDGGGAPYASLVTVTVDQDLAPVLLLSGISDHTRNIVADPRVSLLFDGTAGHPNPQTGPRVTLSGVAEKLEDERLMARFLAHHPGAAQYASFGDFGLWRVRPERAHFVGGFGRAVWFDPPFGQEPGAVAALAAAESSIVDHMNADHADAVDRLAQGAGGAESGWRMIGIDVDGCDLALGGAFVRVAFDSPLDGPAAARTVLADLARRP
ncbi:MAG: DUF2470 domain-containing protein [Magnetospirillum sp.]|nr:DUF2470 domain-containing protein [Magnetospirillum sp.]